MVERSNTEFSVVLPTHNRPELLIEAVQSVFEQTLKDWELIVVDNASESAVESDLARQFPDTRIRVLRNEENLGGAAAKSIGAQSASGKYLAFLDDDDLLDPDHLKSARDVFDRHPETKVLFMGVTWFGEKAKDGQGAQDGNMNIIHANARPHCGADRLCVFDSLSLFSALMERIPMPFQRPVVNRQQFFEIGEYRPECLLWDCDWALRAVVEGSFALLDKGLYKQRAQRQGYSSRAERWIEQEESKIEMKEHMLQNSELPKDFGKVLNTALANDWFSYAWQLQEKRRWPDANRALSRAASYRFNARILKLYLKGLAKRVSAGQT